MIRYSTVRAWARDILNLALISLLVVAAFFLVGGAMRATRLGEDLLVDITDDGPGFEEDAIKAGHGLDNLQRRLLALYGERASLEFLRPSIGMTVRLRVPGS